MKIIIIGAGGCFGQNCAMHLVAQGHQVIGIARAPVKPECFSLGFRDLNYRYEVLHLVNDLPSIMCLIEDEHPDAVINYAAQAGLVPDSWNYPEWFYEANTMAVVNLWEWLKRMKYRGRFVQIGTSELYGSREFPAVEQSQLQCTSPYAVSKAAADMHLETMKSDQIIVVRPSNCYCPGQALHRLIPRAVLAALTWTKMPLQGGGKVKKSYMHANDLSAAVELLLTKPGGIYNVGPMAPIAIRDIVQYIAQLLNKGLDDIAEVTEGRSNEDQTYWLNSAKMRALGWSDNIDIRTGLAGMIDWGRMHLEELRQQPIEYRIRP